MSRPTIYVTRVLPEEALSVLERCGRVRLWAGDGPVPRDVLLREARDAEALFCLVTERIDEELVRQAPRLRIVALMAVGYDNVQLGALGARGIVLSNTPGILAETTADLTFALILAVARRVVEAERFVRAGKWRAWEPLLLAGRDVHHATLGVVGLGQIGTEVAKRARGFDMRVLYVSRTRKPGVEKALGCVAADLPTLLGESDFVTLHLPLTPQTRHMISAAELRLMRRSAYLINAARGSLVDQQALVEALRERVIAGAALDVTDPEPVPPGDPLLALDNCLILPHIGSATTATRTRMAVLAAKNVAAFFATGRPLTPVNPEVLDRRP